MPSTPHPSRRDPANSAPTRVSGPVVLRRPPQSKRDTIDLSVAPSPNSSTNGSRARTHVSPNQAQQYRWAAKHINAGLGAIAVSRLERSDVSTWLESLAHDGKLSRRSIQIIRMTLRAAMANAVASGELRRNVVAHVPMPRDVKRLPKAKDADAWDSDEIERFVAVTRDHRWGGPILLQLMYGLRRSELLALRWSSVDLDAATVAIVAGLVESDGQLGWSPGKNTRSRRRIALDPAMTQTSREHRRRSGRRADPSR